MDLMSEAITFPQNYEWDLNIGFTLYYIVNQEYKEAYYWAKMISRKLLVYDPILRCSILGYLGRTKEALEVYEEILTLTPDFPEKASKIVGVFLLDKNLQELILHGLSLTRVDLLQMNKG